MDHHPDVEAEREAPSYLTGDPDGQKYAWFYWGPPPVRFVPLGVYSDPPPPELELVQAVRVGDGRAAEAAAWVTRQLNRAATVYDKLLIGPPP